MTSEIEKLKIAFAQSTSGKWGHRTSTTSDSIESPISLVVDSNGEALLSHQRGISVKAQRDVEFIAQAHNLMPALLDLFNAIDDGITADDIGILDSAKILKIMSCLKGSNSIAAKTEQDGALINLTTPEGSLDKAMNELLTDPSLSIYKFDVVSFVWNNDKRKPYRSIEVFLTSKDNRDKERLAKEIASQEFKALREKSASTDDWTLLPGDTMITAGHIALFSGMITKIRSVIDNYDHEANGTNFALLKELGREFQGGSVWKVNGKPTHQVEVGVLVAKHLCNMPWESRSKAMDCFDTAPSDEQRLA